MSGIGHCFATALFALSLAAPSLQVARGEEARLSAEEFDRLFQQLHVKNQPWASIPWQTNVTEARRLAANQKKPIFMAVNTGNCLGYT